ncbi:MAG: ATP-binding protein [Bacteroidetes bacterium]|nr:ATP-binding protein [Bacteroidota bacterium]
MEQHFGRHIDELEAIVSFLDRVSTEFGLDSGAKFVLNMAVEELYTNMVKYNGEGADDILIGVECDQSSLVIHLVDFDSKPFDYSEREEVDIHASLHDRKPGGLGIHLVKRFMDEVNYQYKDRKTSIKLVKFLKTNA